MAEEDVTMELEAVEAVYGDDCVVIESYPPHIHLHIKPRTADVSSQKFVEAIIGIRAGPQYPKESPHVNLVESKGLDDQRRKHLISSVQEKACELSSCLMLVALCEESVEKLSAMNHPDGDCPLCLYPLVPKDEDEEILPFMKLMSCFHCFHSECIIRWWNWLQSEKESNADNSCTTVRTVDIREMRKDKHGAIEEDMGNCPVCRKVFQAKDLEHVLDLVGSQPCQLGASVTEVDNSEKLLHSDSETVRREKFEAILKLQEERSGLIEPRRELVVSPGMFLPQPVTPAATSTKENTEQEQRAPAVPTHVNLSGSSNRPSTSNHRYSGMRKPRGRNPRKPVRRWIRKDSSTAD